MGIIEGYNVQLKASQELQEDPSVGSLTLPLKRSLPASVLEYKYWRSGHHY